MQFVLGIKNQAIFSRLGGLYFPKFYLTLQHSFIATFY